jgi:hypothetical protein
MFTTSGERQPTPLDEIYIVVLKKRGVLPDNNGHTKTQNHSGKGENETETENRE